MCIRDRPWAYLVVPGGIYGSSALLRYAATQAADWATTLNAFARCVRITRPLKDSYTLRPDALGVAEERGLLDGLLAAEAEKDGTVETFIAALRRLTPPITALFDAVLIMDEDATVRENRLALLQRVAGLSVGVADLSQLERF